MNITLLVFILLVPILALILLGLNTLLSSHKSYEDKLSSYECGQPVIIGQTRESFQVHFLLVAMLFLVFDIELVLLLPASVSLSSINTFGFFIVIIFFIILTIGFVFEIASQSITIKPNKSNSSDNNKKYPIAPLPTPKFTVPGKHFRLVILKDLNNNFTAHLEDPLTLPKYISPIDLPLPIKPQRKVYYNYEEMNYSDKFKIDIIIFLIFLPRRISLLYQNFLILFHMFLLPYLFIFIIIILFNYLSSDPQGLNMLPVTNTNNSEEFILLFLSFV